MDSKALLQQNLNAVASEEAGTTGHAHGSVNLLREVDAFHVGLSGTCWRLAFFLHGQ